MTPRTIPTAVLLLALAACSGGDATTTAATTTAESTSTTAESTSTDEPTSTDTTTADPPTTGMTGGGPTTTGTTADSEPEPTTGTPACITPADCPAEECRAADCIAGACVLTDMPEGTPVDAQPPGDCALAVCDGQGGVTIEPDPADLPDDGIACSDEACDGLTPVHTPQQQPCYTGPDGTQGLGACVAGTMTCDLESGDFGPCVGAVTPTTETCEPGLVDEDCDGLTAPCCGDGVMTDAEPCDDGNPSDADACTTTCAAQAVLQVAHGGAHGCARLSGGMVKCWGAGDNGRTGHGNQDTTGDGPGEMGAALPAVDLGAGLTADSIAAGEGHSCALLAGGTLKCWGSNKGELGLGDLAQRGDDPGELGDALPAVDLGPGVTATAVTAGSRFSCALLAGGAVKCWGLQNILNPGQLGLGDTESRGDQPDEMGGNLPTVDLDQDATVVALSSGANHSCALLAGGAVKCWGYNFNGPLGLGDTQNRGDDPGEMGANLPTALLAGPAAAVSCGQNHSCALLADDRVQCWGGNIHGQLGLGDTQNRGDNPGEMGPNLPTVDLGAGKLAVQVAAGNSMTCALLDDATLKCWGWNANGGLGLGDLDNRGDGPGEMGDALPTVDLGAGLTAASLGLSATGSNEACAALTDGSAKCWGANFDGQLGLGDTADRGDMPGEMADALPRIKLFSDAW